METTEIIRHPWLGTTVALQPVALGASRNRSRADPLALSRAVGHLRSREEPHPDTSVSIERPLLMIDLDTLSHELRSELQALVERVGTADGVSPINESGELVMAGQRPGRFLLAREDERIVGVAVVDERDATIQVAVDAEHRRRGHGARLLEAALSRHPDHTVWAFGTLPGAAGLAAALHLTPARELLKMSRPLHHEAEPSVPAGWQIRGYRAGDADGVVAVNAEAFSHHPEQGKLTLQEFQDLSAQPWFSPNGLIVAVPEDDEAEIAGFHWTKRHDDSVGEVYVLAVHSAQAGRGLGRTLLEAGLAHLSAIGCTEVILFVEASEERVVEMYRSASFETINTDTSYRS